MPGLRDGCVSGGFLAGVERDLDVADRAHHPAGIGIVAGLREFALLADARLQHLINRFSRRTLVGIASRYGGQIVQLVSETVRRWDARTVTERIESAVGRDLQFIRINGTMVGGLVGLAIHFVDSVL